MNRLITRQQVSPIAPMDILFGWREAMVRGQLYMAHRCGFTRKTLQMTLRQDGFASVAILREKNSLALYAVATKTPMMEDDLIALCNRHWGRNPPPASPKAADIPASPQKQTAMTDS